MTHLDNVTSLIDQKAIDIIDQLQKEGFTAYLVGGCVRDILLGLKPKDFDIVTDAKPREIKYAIKNCFIIGKRFKLVLVKRGDKQFEVATFRKNPEDKNNISNRDNVFGTPVKDAARRDFTINSIFYDPINKKIIDYENGIQDIKQRVIRMIGEPAVRLKEDPIRILRALRFAEKLNFSIEPQLRKTMEDLNFELKNSKLPRIREEILKILKLKTPELVFLEILDLKIMKHIMPTLHKVMQNKSGLLEFSIYLNSMNICDEQNSKEYFIHLTLGFLTAFKKYNPETKIKKGSISKNDTLTNFMKNELGVFPTEIIQICTFLENFHLLKEPKHDPEIFREIGYETALKFARLEQILPTKFRSY